MLLAEDLAFAYPEAAPLFSGVSFQVSAGEIASIEEELDAVYGVLMRAQAAGVAVNVSYVA